MWRYNVEPKRGVEVGPVGSLLALPFLLVAAVLSVPFFLVAGCVQQLNNRKMQTKMKTLGRVMEWSDFIRALDEARGTAIVERYSLGGPVYLWWTSENVYHFCPYPAVDWWALHDASFLPFAEWYHEQYTSPKSGRAFLVGLSPKGGQSWNSRCEDGVERWIEVVPAEVARKKRKTATSNWIWNKLPVSEKSPFR
jgi:hypothetical protein